MFTPREGRWVSLKNRHGAQARRGLAFAPIKARHAEGGTRCPYCVSTPSVTTIGWSPSRWPGYVVRREADYDQGVLTLRIPVAEAAKPRRVEITKSAGGQRSIVEGQAARTS